MELFLAKTYELNNGQCYVDGVLQSSTDACSFPAKILAGIIGLIVFILIINIVFLIFWVIALVHAVKNTDIKDRNIWLIGLIASFFVGLAWIAAIVYYFAVMRPYKKGGVSEVQPPSQPTV